VVIVVYALRALLIASFSLVVCDHPSRLDRPVISICTVDQSVIAPRAEKSNQARSTSFDHVADIALTVVTGVDSFVASTLPDEFTSYKSELIPSLFT
jgi:hypothetical protein